jgi:hypothetical protein
LSVAGGMSTVLNSGGLTDVGKFADDRVLIHPKPPQRGIARSQLHCAVRNDGLHRSA